MFTHHTYRIVFTGFLLAFGGSSFASDELQIEKDDCSIEEKFQSILEENREKMTVLLAQMNFPTNAYLKAKLDEVNFQNSENSTQSSNKSNKEKASLAERLSLVLATAITSSVFGGAIGIFDALNPFPTLGTTFLFWAGEAQIRHTIIYRLLRDQGFPEAEQFKYLSSAASWFGWNIAFRGVHCLTGTHNRFRHPGSYMGTMPVVIYYALAYLAKP